MPELVPFPTDRPARPKTLDLLAATSEVLTAIRTFEAAVLAAPTPAELLLVRQIVQNLIAGLESVETAASFKAGSRS